MNIRLEPGHCWLSGKQCFEIKEVYNKTNGPLNGHVKHVGAPNSEAYNVHMLIMNLSMTPLPIHIDALYRLDYSLNSIWHSVMERNAWEVEHAALLGVNYDGKKHKSECMGYLDKLVVNNPPISIVSIERWDNTKAMG